MSNYTHTAADALALAERLKLQVQRESSAVLSNSECGFVAKIAEIWAEHQPRFKKGDKIVCPQAKPFIFTVHAVHGKNTITVCSHVGLTKISLIDNVCRPATAEEEAAGHRIDEVQND